MYKIQEAFILPETYFKNIIWHLIPAVDLNTISFFFKDILSETGEHIAALNIEPFSLHTRWQKPTNLLFKIFFVKLNSASLRHLNSFLCIL